MYICMCVYIYIYSEPLTNYEEPRGAGSALIVKEPLRATEEPRGGERSHSERALESD